MSRRQKRSRLERRRYASVRARALQVGGGAVVATLAPAAAAHAATFNVTNLNDTGAGSLRQAMLDANSAGGSTTDDIVFASSLSGTVHLHSDLPSVAVPMDIEGPGARKVVLDGSGTSAAGSIVYDNGHPLTISGLSIDNAHKTSVSGAISSQSALTLVGDEFVDDSGYIGGAVSVGFGSATIDDSTFSSDSAEHQGGGLFTQNSPTIVRDSTFAENSSAAYGGGGVYLDAGTTQITGTTITGNSASSTGGDGPRGYGGGIDLAYSGHLTLQNSVVAGNTATGNPDAISGPRSFRDIYVASQEFTGTTASASFSLIQHDASQPGLTLNSSDITGESPDLGSLANNGGPTETELPAISSPVVNAGKAFGLTADQRGFSRTVVYPGRAVASGGDGTDMGAVELQAPVVPVVSGLSRGSGSPGESVIIDGSGFSGASKVLFGSASAKFTVQSATKLVATVPDGKGSVDVRVVGPSGESAAVSADKFSYLKAGLSHKGKVSAKRKGKSVLVLTGLTVTCASGGDRCRTTVSGESAVPASLARVRRKKTKRTRVGSATVVVRPGHHDELEFKLNSHGLRALKKKHKLRITVTARSTDGSVKSSATRTITIRLPKAKKKK